ncbi:MAG: hypothetical protein QG646_578 [Euryarchaeota archaeon]|nr:hypothetical protein [Euryarchaeota archaeon]
MKNDNDLPELMLKESPGHAFKRKYNNRHVADF